MRDWSQAPRLISLLCARTGEGMAEPKELLRQTRLAMRHLETVERQLAEAVGQPSSVQSAAAAARGIQAWRRRRSEFLPAQLLAEPAWDMLLALYLARSDGNEAYSYSIFREANVAPATGARFLDKLEDACLIDRGVSTADRRQKPIRLTETAYQRMTEMLCAMVADDPGMGDPRLRGHLR